MKTNKNKDLVESVRALCDQHVLPDLKIGVGGTVAAGVVGGAELEVWAYLPGSVTGKVHGFTFEKVFRNWLKDATKHSYEDECCDALVHELEAALKWLKPKAAKARRRAEREFAAD